MRDDFNYSNSFYLFYRAIYKKQKVVELTYLKDIVSKKFYPVMQYDSHEFMMFLLSSL